jgi:ABC-type branched-subunit amino acid transport system substrate-binding protein
LFLPEGGADLAIIGKQLSGAGFDPQKIRMLGTGLWDDLDTAQQAPLVVGGWYAAPDAIGRQNFVAAYKATYNEDPPRLATLAYDATALAAVLAKRGARFDTAALTNPNGFAGLDGIFRLKPTGEVERGLAVLEVTPTGPRDVDSAPPCFAAAAF